MTTPEVERPSNRLTEDELARIRKLMAEGNTPKQIAGQMKRSMGAIRKAIVTQSQYMDYEPKKYDEVERARLLNLTFAKLEQLVHACTDGFQLRALVEAFKTLQAVQGIETGTRTAEDQHFTLNFQVNGTVDPGRDDVQEEIVDAVVTEQREFEAGEEEPEYDPLQDI